MSYVVTKTQVDLLILILDKEVGAFNSVREGVRGGGGGTHHSPPTKKYIFDVDVEKTVLTRAKKINGAI